MNLTTTEEEEADLRRALQYDVLNIVLQQDATSGMRTTTGAVRALTELVWQYLHHSMIPDLVAFSNHTKSRSITIEDVCLILRKLPDKLEQFQSQFSVGDGTGRSVISTTTALRRPTKMRRSQFLTPTSNTRSRKRPHSAVTTTATTTNATETTTSCTNTNTNTVGTHRDREREYEDLLLESSSDDEVLETTTGTSTYTNRKQITDKARQQRQLPHFSPSSSSDDDGENNDNYIDTAIDRNTCIEKSTVANKDSNSNMVGRVSITTTTTAYERFQQKLKELTPLSAPSDKNDNFFSTTNLAITRTTTTTQNKESINNDEEEISVVVPKTKSHYKRNAILDDQDDISEANDEENEFSINYQASPTDSQRSLNDSPLKASQITTSHSERKEIPKSQVADILANLSYDSGPESSEHADERTNTTRSPK